MAAERPESKKGGFPWHLGVYDAHCHPTDTVSSLDRIPHMKTRALTIMATREQDQDLVAHFANKLCGSEDPTSFAKSVLEQNCIVPAFGRHPWFSHQVYDNTTYSSSHPVGPPKKTDHYKSVLSPSPEDDDFILSLPDPTPLSDLLSQIRDRLDRYPGALVGEIGLDRAFRVPGKELIDNQCERDPALTPGGRDGRRLSPYRVDMDHQRRILTAQLNLAGEMHRAVSIHGVAAHGIVYETLRETWNGHEKHVLSKRAREKIASVDTTVKNIGEAELEEMEAAGEPPPKPFPPRICLHSFSGPSDTLRQYLHPSVPADMFFSFSRLVNFSSSSNKAVEVIRAVPDDKILAESDLHAAGSQMDELMEEIIRSICQIKEWSLEKGVRQLASNWTRFIFGKVETGQLLCRAVTTI